MYTLDTLALRRLVVVLFIMAAMLMSIVSCGGGTSVEITPGQTVDEQVAVISALDVARPADFDHNGIAVSVKFEGVSVTDVENSKVKDKKNLPVFEVGDDLTLSINPYVMAYGFVVGIDPTMVGPQQVTTATREDVAVTDLSATKGLDRNLCEATTKVPGLPDLVSDLSQLREMSEDIDVSSLQQEKDVELEVSCTVHLKNTVAAEITGERLGFKEIPTERLERIRANNTNALAFGLLGIALQHFLPGSAAVIGCGDPSYTIYVKIRIPGHGGKPPVIIPDTDIDLTAPDNEKPGTKFDVTIESDCPGGWALKNGAGGVLATGTGNKTVQVTMTTTVLVLTVTDTCGNTDSETVNPTPDQPTLLAPTAVITANPSTGQVPKTVTFDASGSHDNDENNQSIVDYKWDLDGDGSFEATTGGVATTSHNYTVAGSYTVSVQVTDDEGQTDTESVTITLTNPPVNVTYTIFVAGTKGELSENETWDVDETGSQLVDVFQLKGSDDSSVNITRSNVTPSSDELPFWVFENFQATGEIQTVKWSQPEDPDVEDPGNMFINPGTYAMHFVVTHNGNTYTRNWKLQINDRPDFP